jgi:hypothetical protein
MLQLELMALVIALLPMAEVWSRYHKLVQLELEIALKLEQAAVSIGVSLMRQRLATVRK